MSGLGPIHNNLFSVLSQVKNLLASPVDLGSVPLSTPSGLPASTNLRNIQLAMGLSTPLLENEQTAKLLKEAMKWPEDIHALLADLADAELPPGSQSDARKSLKALLQQLPEGMFSVGTLSDKLEKQTQTGMDKLMKLIQGGGLAQGKSSAQVGELASTLGQWAEQIRANPQQSAKVLILLALPWAPLPQPLELDVAWEEGGGSPEEDSDTVSMVLYLQTNTMGRLKLVIEQLEPLQAMVTLSHEPVAKPMLPVFEELLNAYLASDGLPEALWEYQEMALPTSSYEGLARAVEEGHFKGVTRQANRQEVQMQKNGRISALVLSCATFLARAIFELDNQNRPLNQ